MASRTLAAVGPNATLVEGDLEAAARRLKAEREGEIEVAVFVEDFSGTGQTLETWWYTIEPAILPKVPVIVFGLLVLNFVSRPKHIGSDSEWDDI